MYARTARGETIAQPNQCRKHLFDQQMIEHNDKWKMEFLIENEQQLYNC